MYSLLDFKKSHWSLLAYKGNERIFASRGSGLVPLIKLLKLKKATKNKLIVFDKYIGRAAALLFTKIKPQKIYTLIISKAGRVTLEKYLINYNSLKTVKYLMGFSSEQMCHWEKLSINKSPKEFWDLVKSKKIS